MQMIKADFGNLMGRTVTYRDGARGKIVAMATASDGTIRVWVEDNTTHAVALRWLEQLSFA